MWRFRRSGDASDIAATISGRLRFSNGEACVTAAAAGFGIARVPSFTAGAAFRARPVRPVLRDYQTSRDGIFALYPASRHLALKVRVLVDVLSARYRGEPEWDEGSGLFFTNPKGGWEFLALWIAGLLALALAGNGAEAHASENLGSLRSEGQRTMLVDGQWSEDWHPVQATDEQGGFVRQTSGFRDWITPDGSPGPTGHGGFAAQAGRYHLYVALICPWACRTLIARKLKGLDAAISVSIVEPALSEQGWRFGAAGDALNAATYMHEIYTRADPVYTGRATVTVLWDKNRGTIVNNESADIVRILDTGFGNLADPTFSLYPEPLRPQIDALNDAIYPRLNNGVYRAGFATTQAAYEEAFADVFGMLDELEARLSDGGPFLLGEPLTEADIRLFVTLVRFDAAYHGLFKCNLRRMSDYAALSAYIDRMIAVPGIRETVSIDQIKRGYYSIKALNPNGIVPLGPELSFIPAGRAEAERRP